VLIRKLSTDRYQLIGAEASGKTERGTLGDLASLVGDTPVTLIMPAVSCSHREVSFADHERKLLDRIIPWALEEDLIDGVDAMHFVIRKLPAGQSGSSHIAAVCSLEKAVLARELEDFSRSGITLAACLPELLLLPFTPGQWTLAMTDDSQWLARVSENEGLACNSDNLPMACKALLRERPLPERLRIYRPAEGDFPKLQQLTAWLPGISEEAIEFSDADYGQVLGKSFGQQEGLSAWNLLTREFAPRLPWQAWWKQWRVAAMLLAAIGGLDVAARAVELNTLEQLNQQLSAETENAFRQVFPEGAMIDPRLQLQRRLAALQGSSASGFVALLNRAAPVIMDNPELDVQNLNYSERDDEIQMTLITADFNAAETIRSRLQSLGLQAELTGSASSPEGSRSTLSIGRQGVSG